MTVSSRARAGWLGMVGFVMTLAGGSPAIAQVTQTDAVKTPLPRPVPQAEAALINDFWAWNANTMVSRDPLGANLNPALRYGDFYTPPQYPQFVTGDAINLSGLFKWRKETIDPANHAKTGPGYFSAKCGFTGELLLMGSNCQVQLGWYNVSDPASTTPPLASEVYPFITGKPSEQLKCVEASGVPKTDGFCPLAWDNRDPYDLSKLRWTPRAFPSGDISKDPRYKGGYVAFAVIGDPQRCPQNKYSMYGHNQQNASGVPWVTTLIYHSTLDPSGFYLAFEGSPMSPADWQKTPSGAVGADGDFNDLVFYVSGLTCAGGNLPCDTGQFGTCAVGRTDCAATGEAPACLSTRQASPEICDNADNDCDGVVDEGAGLCGDPSKPVCFQGACVGSCKSAEFSCPLGFVCDSAGECVDPTCGAVSCKPGTTCQSGACVDEPCAGVLCPYGKQCELGRCVDPCAGVSCSGQRVCDRGLCVDRCDCKGCDTGLTCGSDGRCIDAACVGKTCQSGLTCQQGACIDPCAGVACPGKGVCSDGRCISPPAGSGGSGSGGGLSFGGSSAAGSGIGGLGEAGEAAAGAAFAGAAGDDHELAGASSTGGSNARGGGTAAGGVNARGGASAAGGVEAPEAPDQKSSGCSFAVLAKEQPLRAWTALGLALGLALVRRRRRPR